MIKYLPAFALMLLAIAAVSASAQMTLPTEEALRGDAQATGELSPFEPLAYSDAVERRPEPNGYDILLDAVEPDLSDSTRAFIRERIEADYGLSFYGAVATGDISDERQGIGIALGAHRIDGAESYAMAQCERLRGDYEDGLPCAVIGRVLPTGANDPRLASEDIVPMNNILAAVLPDIEGFVGAGDLAVAVSRGGKTATYAGGPDARETAVAECNAEAAATLWIEDCYLFAVGTIGEAGGTLDRVLGADAEGGRTGGSDTPPAASQAVFEAFLDDHGQDFEACFVDLPEIQGAGAVAEYVTAEEIGAEVRRMILAVDASGSMAGQFGGQTKMQAAVSAADSFVSSTPDDVDVGLVAFGHKGSNDEGGKAESCNGVETLVPLGADRPAVSENIAGLEPTGWTPLASAIRAAAAQLDPSEEGEQVVYIVSDGKETCGGDPVTAARDVVESELKAVVNIIGFDLEEADRVQLQAVAEAGGGAFVEADPDTDLRQMLEDLRARATNTGARVGAVADAASRGTENNAAMSNALTDMRACIANARLSELAAVYPWFVEIRAGDYDRETRQQVETLLKARHKEFATRAEAVRRLGEAALDEAQEKIDASREETEEGFNDVQNELDND